MQPDNNRVRVHLAGVAGNIYGFEYRLIASYARNWGQYTAPQNSHNTALLLDVSKHVPQAWGLNFGLRLAADIGSQWGNRFGAMLTINKQGIIHHW